MTASTKTRIIDPLNFDLLGSSLIEASAGTGKTWTIAALYVRLILGHGGLQPKLPEEILVLTFTKAAAKELRERIRTRLVEAAEFFAGTKAIEDPYLLSLKADIDVDKHQSCARILDLAAQSMDLAAIATIHSWCQSVLQQHAFDSNSMFDQNLIKDTSAEKRMAIWDYWRKNIALLNQAQIAEIKRFCKGPSALHNFIKDIEPGDFQDLGDFELAAYIDEQLAGRVEKLLDLKKYWRAAVDELAEWLIHLSPKGKLDRYQLNWIGKIKAWADDADSIQLDLQKGWLRLSPAEIKAKYSLTDAEIAPVCKAIDVLNDSLANLPSAKTGFYKHAFYWVNFNYQNVLDGKSALDFNKLLLNLQQALHGVNGQKLADTLRAQYPIVLVDEFQDTDPIQYSIFDRIYDIAANRQDTTVVFIGDPKQSIYKFRGADIYTYLKAASECGERIFTLNRNYRSAKNMVGAVNKLFSYPNHDVFITGDPALTVSFHEVEANGIDEELLLNNSSISAINSLWLEADDGKAMKVGDYREQSAKACANKISAILNLASKGLAVLDGAKGVRSIASSDIAVLVNTAKEAKIIQQALTDVGVRSVFYSENTSVFKSFQALELQFWLIACINPQSSGAVKAALATPSIGLDWDALEQLNSDEIVWESYVEKFMSYHAKWQNSGVLAMLYDLLHDFAVPSRLLADKYNGERSLTNFLHLAEILQNAALSLDGELALIRYLEHQIENDSNDEDSLLRLESDSELVKIVTIHKSKGLEYPLVFLPFISAGIKRFKPELPVLANIQANKTWLFELDHDAFAKIEQDSLGEEVRKLYVALTRARHAVWINLKAADDRLCGLDHVIADNKKSVFVDLAKDKELFSFTDTVTENSYFINTKTESLVPKPELKLTTPVIKDHWWVSSYSALSLAVKNPYKNITTDNYLEYNLEESLIESRLLALNRANTSSQNNLAKVNTLQQIPKGSNTGTFLHDVLQCCAEDNFQDLAKANQLINKNCVLIGWQEHTEALQQWLAGFVQNKWQIEINDSSFKLNELKSCLPEMEFLLPVNKLDIAKLDEIINASFHHECPRPELMHGHLNGMFKGYIDLCFLNQDGKYYLVDYKSNFIGDYVHDYSDEALIQAMLEMRYDVQMILYLLALHRQLKARLPEYEYEKHIGGAIYMFLRGQEAVNQGLVSFKPDLATIDALDLLFSGGGYK